MVLGAQIHTSSTFGNTPSSTSACRWVDHTDRTAGSHLSPAQTSFKAASRLCPHVPQHQHHVITVTTLARCCTPTPERSNGVSLDNNQSVRQPLHPRLAHLQRYSTTLPSAQTPQTSDNNSNTTHILFRLHSPPKKEGTSRRCYPPQKPMESRQGRRYH